MDEILHNYGVDPDYVAECRDKILAQQPLLTDQDRADIVDALLYAEEDLRYRVQQGRDFDTVDTIEAKLARWAKLVDKLAKAV